MTAIEMSLTRQAITNAFSIVLLLVVCIFLIRSAFRRYRELRQVHKLGRSLVESTDYTILIVNTPFSRSQRPATTAAKNPSLRSR